MYQIAERVRQALREHRERNVCRRCGKPIRGRAVWESVPSPDPSKPPVRWGPLHPHCKPPGGFRNRMEVK